jgi:hypothetical protein
MHINVLNEVTAINTVLFLKHEKNTFYLLNESFLENVQWNFEIGDSIGFRRWKSTGINVDLRQENEKFIQILNKYSKNRKFKFIPEVQATEDLVMEELYLFLLA